MTEPELPSLVEAAAVMKAVDVYAETMGERAMVADMPAWLERLAAAIERLRAVTR